MSADRPIYSAHPPWEQAAQWAAARLRSAGYREDRIREGVRFAMTYEGKNKAREILEATKERITLEES